MTERQHRLVMDLLKEGSAKVCAPMVKYSKLPFRQLVREHGCDLAFTPMIIANSFVRSEKARHTDFITNQYDRPLIVQFAASNADDFVAAAELVSRFCDGVDLNCGCPQRWALEECLGAHLLDHPDIVKDIIGKTRNRLNDGWEDFTISLKVRIHSDLTKTVELCRRAEKAGASFITVHGRTKDQRRESVNVEAMQILSSSVQCPVIANGAVLNIADYQNLLAQTGAKGVMVAQGLLSNPALFAGYDVTPLECVKRWLQISLDLGISFPVFHQHLMFMCEKLLPRAERRVFNVLNGVTAVLDYFEDYYGIVP